MTPLGVALIGAGEIGSLRAAAVRKTPGLELRQVADLRETLARELAGKDARATTSWEEAIAADGIDLVIVSTPPNLHATMGIAAMELGRHVLCEKPLAHTVEDAERLCAAADRHEIMLKTGFNHRYFASMQYARRIIEDGRIGKVVSIRAFAGHQGGSEFGHPWVTDGTVTGGGSLVDNGIHILDLVRFFGGEASSAQGMVGNLVWSFPAAEDNAFATFRMHSGALASLHASWTEWRGYSFRVEAQGTLGYVRASYPPMLAILGTIREAGERAKRKVEIFPMLQLREKVSSWRWTIIDSFVRELTDMIRGIERGVSVPPTGVDGLKALQMAHAVYRSSREGVEVALPGR